MKNIVYVLSLFATIMLAESKVGGLTHFDYTNAEEISAFNFNRQYILFSGTASDDVKYKVIFDVGRLETNDRLVAYLKKAQIDYNASSCKVSIGMIGMNTYGVQEKNWGYRFIEKSAIDKNGFSSTADIGVGFSKAIMDDLNLNLQVVNGEGFKSPQVDKYHKISLNATYGEAKLNKNDGYNAGVVYSTESSETDPTTMVSVFGGCAGNGLRVGGEYDVLTNSDGTKKTLLSISLNYGLKDDVDVFARYDMNDPNADVEKDGDNYLIAGVVLNCGSGLSISPNLRLTSYENDIESNSEYKINCQFKF